MRIGVVFPQTEIGTDPGVIRDYAQAVEDMGFDHILAYDHVLGANLASRPDWDKPYSHDSVFHEPLTLFAYLAGVTKYIGLASGIIVLPQRQTAMLAKQAANVDVFSGGRLRLGFGTGWNEVEYEALGVPMKDRGARLDEQVEVLRQLWSGEPVTYRGQFHSISDAGINPPPVKKRIPVWFGGITDAAMRRVARTGDGWIPVFPAEQADEKIGQLHELVSAAGRDPSEVGVENIIFVGQTIGGPVRSWEDAARDFEVWKAAGASHVSIHTMAAGLKTPDEHLQFLERFMAAVA